MARKLEKFMEVKKILEDAKTTFQPLKGIGNVIIEQSYDRSTFERGVSRILEGIASALNEMDDQTIGFLNAEIEQGTDKPDEED